MQSSDVCNKMVFEAMIDYMPVVLIIEAITTYNDNMTQ
jgi:hypothetical protein